MRLLRRRQLCQLDSTRCHETSAGYGPQGVAEETQQRALHREFCKNRQGLFGHRTKRIRRGLFKARVAIDEDEIEAAGRAVALLGNDEFGLGAFLVGKIGLVKTRAVNEENDVRVLLDGARFAKVGQLRLAIFALGRESAGSRRARELSIPWRAP